MDRTKISQKRRPPRFGCRQALTVVLVKLRQAVITDSLQESGWASHKRRLQAGLRFNKGTVVSGRVPLTWFVVRRERVPDPR